MDVLKKKKKKRNKLSVALSEFVTIIKNLSDSFKWTIFSYGNKPPSFFSTNLKTKTIFIKRIWDK